MNTRHFLVFVAITAVLLMLLTGMVTAQGPAASPLGAGC